MGGKRVFRVILLLATVAAALAATFAAEFEGHRREEFIALIILYLPIGYAGYFAIRTLYWVFFRGSNGDGLNIIPVTTRILSLPFRPFIALGRFIARKSREAAERQREALERPERERRAAEAAKAEEKRREAEREAAYWASPAGQEVRAAQALADIELKKSVALANLAMTQQDAAMEAARLLRQEEEERERRRVELIKSI